MIYFYLANGFEETEALYPLDICRRAGLTAKTVSITESPEVTGAHGITVKADITVFSPEYDISELEAVVLPGGMPGTLNLEKSTEVEKAVRLAYDGGRLVCAICAAPSILGKLGMLKGKKAVCYPGFEKYLDGAYATDEKCVSDGNIITAVGAGAAALFGLEITARLAGRAAAENVKNAILL